MKGLFRAGLLGMALVGFRVVFRVVVLWDDPATGLAILQVLSVVGLLALGCGMRFLLPYVIYGLQQIGEHGWKAWPRFEAKYLSAFGLAFIGYGAILVTVPGAVAYLAGMQPLAVVAIAYAGQDLGVNVAKRARERRGTWVTMEVKEEGEA